MTENTPDPAETDVTDLAQLISEVHQLNGTAAANAREMKKLAVSNQALRTSRRRHRLALIGVGISLAVDLFLTVVAFHVLGEQSDFKDQQACVNYRSQQFFTAEQAKVRGQVAGLRKLQHAGNDRTKALAGFNQFIDASQHYLDRIGELQKC